MAEILTEIENQIRDLHEAGTYKNPPVIDGPMGSVVKLSNGREVINLCSNNYLGLANHPELIRSAQDGLKRWGFGLSSVRFICGTQTIHKVLERKISEFLLTDDTILYTSCFDANGGLFETLLGREDAVISDQLNHASIIDGIRLCKAVRFPFTHSNMTALEKVLNESLSCRTRLIATDGVFSMDGDVAQLDKICDLAEKYDALVMVDDSHATGFFGSTGRGTIEHCNVMGRVDIITSTLGKALGGASGGFISGHQEIIDILRQRSRPYLFSNTLAPGIVAATIACLDKISKTSELRDRLENNTRYFRKEMTEAGFDIKPGIHPIVPIMTGDAKLARDMASDLLSEGIYVIGFSYPVVPKGEARIRVQISAAHTRAFLDRAIKAFVTMGRKYKLV